MLTCNTLKKTKNSLVLILGILFLSQASSVCAQPEKPDLKEGAWRIAIQMTVPNAKGPSTGPMQYDRCLAPGNVKTLLAMPAGTPCTLKESKLTRDDLSWEMSCSQEGYKSTVNGKINFKKTTLDGEIITLAQGPQKIRITTRIAGRYLGECVNIKQEPSPRTHKPLPKFED